MEITECKGKTRKRKKAQGKCVSVGCQKEAAKRRTLCHMHIRRKQKYENPHSYYYYHVRQNARNRGIGFNWTLEEFKEFCKETNYLEKKGRTKNSYTIDRIDPDKPYQKDNVQVLTCSANARKQHVDFKIKYGRYPSREDLEYLREQMANEDNPEPQLPEFEEEVDPETVPF